MNTQINRIIAFSLVLMLAPLHAAENQADESSSEKTWWNTLAPRIIGAGLIGFGIVLPVIMGKNTPVPQRPVSILYDFDRMAAAYSKLATFATIGLKKICAPHTDTPTANWYIHKLVVVSCATSAIASACDSTIPYPSRSIVSTFYSLLAYGWALNPEGINSLLQSNQNNDKSKKCA